MIEITTEVGRGLTKRGAPTIRQALEGAAAIIASVLGETIKRRVTEQANTAGQNVSDWDTRFKGVMVSARYPGAERGQPTKSGAFRFQTNRDFHVSLGRRLGAYPMTGLSRVITSPTFVQLRFRGRSEGQDGRIINGKSRPLKASNALKAWTVFAMKRVNLLAMTEGELRAIESGMTHTAALGLSSMLSIQWTGGSGGPGGDSTEAIFRAAFGMPKGAPLPDAAPGM